MLVAVSAVNMVELITVNVVPSHLIAPRSFAMSSSTAPTIFASPDLGAGFVASLTHVCEFAPIGRFVADPHVLGAVNVLYVICPAKSPYTRSPLFPVSSHAKSNGRRSCTSIPVVWVTLAFQALPVQ